MASTYTTNLALDKKADGDFGWTQAGRDNLDAIDSAISSASLSMSLTDTATAATLLASEIVKYAKFTLTGALTTERSVLLTTGIYQKLAIFDATAVTGAAVRITDSVSGPGAGGVVVQPGQRVLLVLNGAAVTQMPLLNQILQGETTVADVTETLPAAITGTTDLGTLSGTTFKVTANVVLTLPTPALGKSFTVVATVAISSSNWVAPSGVTILWAGGAAPTPVGPSVFAFIAASATEWYGTMSIDGVA